MKLMEVLMSSASSGKGAEEFSSCLHPRHPLRRHSDSDALRENCFRGSALGRVDFWREFGGWRPALCAAGLLDLLGLHPLVIGHDPLTGRFR